MKKVEQLKINNACMEELKKALDELSSVLSINAASVSYDDFMKLPDPGKRLRSCSAVVYTTENYYILKSYNTIIAVINKTTDTLYDCLRIVYGYTATSSQHISKFSHDYGSGKYSCSKVYTAR